MKVVGKIGVLGQGQLGSSIAWQLSIQGENVRAWDPAIGPNGVRYEHPVDPSRDEKIALSRLKFAADQKEVLSGSDIVHWAVPSSLLDDIPVDVNGAHIILHDSVMSNSISAIKDRPDASRFIIVHFLMNQQRKVVVAEGYNTDLAVAHIKSLGLSPEVMTVDEHDMIMARTQGEYMRAMIKNLKLFRDMEARGLLPPSSHEFLVALKHREGRWSDATLRSIASNPHLDLDEEEVEAYITWRNSERVSA